MGWKRVRREDALDPNIETIVARAHDDVYSWRIELCRPSSLLQHTFPLYVTRGRSHIEQGHANACTCVRRSARKPGRQYVEQYLIVPIPLSCVATCSILHRETPHVQEGSEQSDPRLL